MKSLTFLALSSSLAFADVDLYPTLQFTGLVGESSADSLSDIAGHAHDPNNDFALQGLDVGINLKIDDWFAAFINMNSFTTSDHDLESEWEEGFIKFQDLPGGFEVRGGRFLNRLGLQNNRHLHAWNFVNANLSTSQFLGEEGLITEGIEVTWMKEFDQSFLALTASYGKAAEHDHDHGHGDEHDDDHDDDHEDDHDDEDGHDDDGHEDEHGHGEASEDALFTDELITARALFGYNHTDFHQHRLGINGAWGNNGYDRDTSLYSIDYTYTWRENGIDTGGRSFSIGAEYFNRNVQWSHPENAANQGSTDQSGYMAFANYRFAENWIADLRYEHLQGRSAGPELDLGEIEYAFATGTRDRFSVALTREFQLQDLASYVRLQYSHDDTEEGNDDSIWLQFGFGFGGGEVR